MKLAQLQVQQVASLDDLSVVSRIDSTRFAYRTDAFEYQCLLRPKENSNRLFVILHGAKAQDVAPPPYFDRWSWAPDFPGSMLLISDPTVSISEKLRLAWYVGNRHEWPLEVIADIVRSVCVHLEIDLQCVVPYGSSGGGFAAIALVGHLKQGTAIAVNPQTNIFKYYGTHVADVAKYCFPELGSHDVILGAYGKRVDVVSNYPVDSKAKVVLLQNVQDEFHYTRHYEPLAARLSSLYGENQFVSRLYHHESGHGPEPRTMLPQIWQMAFG